MQLRNGQALGAGLSARAPSEEEGGMSNISEAERQAIREYHANRMATPEPAPPPPRSPANLCQASHKIVTASALQTMTFKPVRYVLPGYIPEGLTILAGKPKIGKSWLLLDLALGATADRFVLGTLKPAQGDVLYLALEDNQRRLQRRLKKIWPSAGANWPESLQMATEWSRIEDGGMERIARWCDAVENPRVICVDTLALFRSLRTGGRQDPYRADYEALSGLQRLAGERQIAIVVAHHLRKSDADDPFDTVSGTLGLTGAADTILIIRRASGGVTLHARGRDIEEVEVALQFEKPTCRWTILGMAAEVHVSAQRAAIIDALAAEQDGMTVSDIMAAIGSTNRNAIYALLFRMTKDGEVRRLKQGSYALSEERKTRKNVKTDSQATDNIDEKSQSYASYASYPPTEPVRTPLTPSNPTPHCAQCGKPGDLLECASDGVVARLHRDCIDAWQASVVRDDLTIPPYLDRRGNGGRAHRVTSRGK
jgi:hypothetical protein